MENWGLVIYRETALLYDPLVSSSSNKYMVTLIVAHEIAHTWFGNMATMRWWDDLWLNEGFASILMYIAMDHVYPSGMCLQANTACGTQLAGEPRAVNGTFVIGRIMDTWTRQMGYPMVHVVDRGGYYELHQSRFLLHDNGTQYNASETPYGYLRRVILSIACDVGVTHAVETAKRLFKNWMEVGQSHPADLSLPVYSVGVREGGVEEWDFVWNKSQSTKVASERDMMMEALAQTQKSFLLWRYIQWIFDSDKIKMQDVRVVISYFTKTPLARMVSLQFLMSRWDEMNRRFGEDAFVMREVIQEVTTYVNTEFQLHQLERLFHEKPPKTASKATENALALIRANIDWMTQNYDKIDNWLQNNFT
nr:hypothetical protein BaRGS_034747 [Batillaria attramentaria]